MAYYPHYRKLYICLSCGRRSDDTITELHVDQKFMNNTEEIRMCPKPKLRMIKYEAVEVTTFD